MAFDYGYGELENQLIDLFHSGAPDFAAADKLLQQGADLNAAGKEESENVLSEILGGYCDTQENHDPDCKCRTCEKEFCKGCEENQNPHLGESMVQIIQYFLAHGFDLNRKDGRYGAQCLSALVLSTWDESILAATKLLFDAGAQNKNTEEHDDWDETPWEFVDTEGSNQRCCYNDYHLGNLFEAVSQIYQAREDGRPYAGIDTYMVAIGKRITAVMAEKPESGEVFFDLDVPNFRHKNCYRETLYFVYDGGLLISTKCADAWTDTVWPEGKSFVPVSSVFPGIVGSVIKDIRFEHSEIKKGTTHYFRPIVILETDSGAQLKLTTNFGEVEKEHRAAYFTLQPKAEHPARRFRRV